MRMTLLLVSLVDGMSLYDLRILRNMVYARHGYTFKSNLLGDYFEGYEWYEPDDGYTRKRLRRVDWRNVRLIKSVEKAHGGPITDWAHMKEEGWLGGT